MVFAFNNLFQMAHSFGRGSAENHVFCSRWLLLPFEAFYNLDEFVEIFELSIGSRSTGGVEVKMTTCWSAAEGSVIRCVIQDDDIAGFGFSGNTRDIVSSNPQILAERLKADFM